MVVKKSKKILFLILGWFFLILAVIGIPLPILPTTPFLLLSAYFFSNSSERLHKWLINTKYLGPMITDWESHGVIRLRAKVISTALILALFTYTLSTVQVHFAIKIVVALTGVGVLGFIWTRPTHRLPKQPLDQVSES